MKYRSSDTLPPLERFASMHTARPQKMTMMSENPLLGLRTRLPFENFWSTPVRQWSRGRNLLHSSKYIFNSFDTVLSRRSIC
jgi:hypothetical protein